MLIARAASQCQFYATANRIPELLGAYLLLIELMEDTVVKLPNRSGVTRPVRVHQFLLPLPAALCSSPNNECVPIPARSLEETP
jgi:hypothetical protein